MRSKMLRPDAELRLDQTVYRGEQDSLPFRTGTLVESTDRA